MGKSLKNLSTEVKDLWTGGKSESQSAGKANAVGIICLHYRLGRSDPSGKRMLFQGGWPWVAVNSHYKLIELMNSGTYELWQWMGCSYVYCTDTVRFKTVFVYELVQLGP